MRYLITGTAGFIGFHIARRLIDQGHVVVGFDALTPYYDVTLKKARHAILGQSDSFRAVLGRLEDRHALDKAAALAEPDVIIHLAAQAGVRYSLENPLAYVESNLVGSFNLLELARELKPKHLLLASTSSIYGVNEKIPFAERDKADEPITIYAASKKGMELMAHSHAHLFSIPTTAFRFFTVYGPWGRPDMALFKFTAAIERGEPIELYGAGRSVRDFTYIDDLVTSVLHLAAVVPDEANRVGDIDTLSRQGPFRVVNIGGGQPVETLEMVDVLEATLGRKAMRRLLPMQPGDVPRTFASPELLSRLTGAKPATPLSEGVPRFVDWYRAYHRQETAAGAPALITDEERPSEHSGSMAG